MIFWSTHMSKNEKRKKLTPTMAFGDSQLASGINSAKICSDGLGWLQWLAQCKFLMYIAITPWIDKNASSVKQNNYSSFSEPIMKQCRMAQWSRACYFLCSLLNAHQVRILLRGFIFFCKFKHFAEFLNLNNSILQTFANRRPSLSYKAIFLGIVRPSPIYMLLRA